MKIVAAIAFFLSAAVAATAQNQSRPASVIHHAVSANAQAQAAFDRGLLDYYAYNPEAAEHEFYTAADLDRHLAMAYWGIALSNAPNLNVSATDDRDQQAKYAIERAKALESYATPEDRGLIDAASLRFDVEAAENSTDSLTTYRDALERTARAYPNDPDAAALYAEAALYVVFFARGDFDTMTPARRAAFKAKVATLLPMFQASLAKFPQHVGLLHFYIHAAQMAGESQAAVEAAKELAAFEFPAEDSHLTHMPGHTFFDVGMYDEALDVAKRSVAMDRAEIDCCHPGYYSATRYYQDHNVSFALYAMTQTGHTADAVDLARRDGNPAFIASSLVADRQWAQAAALSPGAIDENVTFSRGIAYAKLGDVRQAQAMLDTLPQPPQAPSTGGSITTAMRLTLAAEIALAGHEDAKALQLLTDASAAASSAVGTETPPLYYYSPHMALAQLATRLGKLDVARAALAAELVASPRSPQATEALAKLNR